MFRAKVRDELKKAGLFDQVDERVWKKDWVIHSEPVGSGESAFKYLAPYIFRVAIFNNRILKLESGQVTFQYKESATDCVKTCTLSAEEFIRRFLQHVLPDRFIKVRYYGLVSPSNRHLLNQARDLLSGSGREAPTSEKASVVKEQSQTRSCPKCGREMKVLERLKPRGREPP
jgi:hypothetical protein